MSEILDEIEAFMDAQPRRPVPARRTPGVDDLWDRLGNDWRPIDGVQPDMRIYARWDTSGEGRAKITGLCVVGSSITANSLRSIPVAQVAAIPWLGNLTWEEFRRDLKPLRRAPGEDPNVFADRVAYYYRTFTQMSAKPAKEIADHSGVPVGTVRGWIREARLRGKLPPGTRGRAG